jgi:hypothetical protein
MPATLFSATSAPERRLTVPARGPQATGEIAAICHLSRSDSAGLDYQQGEALPSRRSEWSRHTGWGMQKIRRLNVSK